VIPRPRNAWFPALRFRSSVSVSVKPCSYCRSVNAVAVLPLPFWTFIAVYHSIEANGRVELSGLLPSIGQADPVGWHASFPHFRVGGAPGLLATTMGKIDTILFERMNGNDKLTETENVILLRKLRTYCG